MERYTRHRRSPLEQDLIARAKALLMERDGLTEEQAHRTLQKRSMDQGLTLVQTARRTSPRAEAELRHIPACRRISILQTGRPPRPEKE